MALLTGLAAMIASGEQPIRLAAEPVPEGVRVQVIGAAGQDIVASFALEVDGGGNRTVHRGSARLGSNDAQVVLSTVTVGLARGRPWHARLRVEPEGRPAYEQSRSAQ